MFDFTGRLKRMEFLGYSIAATVATIIAIAMGIVALDGGEAAASVIFFILALPVIVWNWAIATRRTRDTGLNPWAVLVLLIPYVGFAFTIFLLFAPSDTFLGNKEA